MILAKHVIFTSTAYSA